MATTSLQPNGIPGKPHSFSAKAPAHYGGASFGMFRQVALTSSFQTLSPAPSKGNFTLFLEGDSGGDVVLLGDDGITDVSFGVGKNFTLSGVDLANIQAKRGGADKNEKVTVAGNIRSLP